MWVRSMGRYLNLPSNWRERARRIRDGNEALGKGNNNGWKMNEIPEMVKEDEALFFYNVDLLVLSNIIKFVLFLTRPFLFSDCGVGPSA